MDLLGDNKEAQIQKVNLSQVRTGTMIVFLQCWKDELCFAVIPDVRCLTVIILGAPLLLPTVVSPTIFLEVVASSVETMYSLICYFAPSMTMF